MGVRTALAVLALALGATTASANEPTPAGASRGLANAEASTAALGAIEPEQILVPPTPAPSRRPIVLPVLYVTLAALQAYDAYSTTVGLSRGAAEANPLMQGVAGNSVALWSVKAASTAGSIWMAERLWKRNKAAAIVTMVALNGVMTSVVAHNAATLRELR